MNTDNEVKAGFGRYMGRFFNRLVADTKGLEEFKQRPLNKAIAYAPSRMIDSAEELVLRWQKEQGDDIKSAHNRLPIILIAVDRDFTPTGRSEHSFQVTDSPLTVMKSDPKQRAFKVRTVGATHRTQVLIASHDTASAKSIASQLMLFIDAFENRRLTIDHTFSGITEQWVAQVESADTPVMSIPTGIKNLVMLTIDLRIKTTLPMYEAPKLGEANDGKGDPEDPNDLAGYLIYESTTYEQQFL